MGDMADFINDQGEIAWLTEQEENKRRITMGFKNVEDVITLTGWDSEKKAFKGTNSKGNEFFARKSPKIKEQKMKYNVAAKAKLGKKEGTDVWYINEIDLPASESTYTASAGKVSTGGYDAKGQEKGNMRTNFTNFIIDRWDKTKDLKADIIKYTELLNFGTEYYLGDKPKENEVELSEEKAEAPVAEEEDVF